MRAREAARVLNVLHQLVCSSVFLLYLYNLIYIYLYSYMYIKYIILFLDILGVFHVATMSSWSLPCGYESMSWTRCEDLEDHKQSFMNHQRDFDDHRSQLKSQQVGAGEADLDPLDLR